MEKTEKMLRALFDFQRFAENKRLEAMILSAEEGVGSLDDDELEINAAGDLDALFTQTDGDEDL